MSKVKLSINGGTVCFVHARKSDRAACKHSKGWILFSYLGLHSDSSKFKFLVLMVYTELYIL